MNEQQFEKMKSGRGFIAALDQSGGSTPKALEAYGIPPDAYLPQRTEPRRVAKLVTSSIVRPPSGRDKVTR